MSFYVGKYFRKQGVYDPNDGWCRKWTYKVGYHISGRQMHLVAMTDGMLSGRKGHREVSEWIEKQGMVQMTKSEIIEFFNFEKSNLSGE